MRFRRSLRFRIIVTFCLFGTILGVVFAVTVFFLLHGTEDYVLNNTLSQEVDYFAEQYRRNPQAALPYSKHWRSYLGSASLPSFLHDVIGQDDSDDGIYEYYLPENGAEYHIAVHTLIGDDDSRQRLYLVYEVSAIEPLHGFEGPLILILLGGLILVIVLGAWLGFMTADTVIAPLRRLADRVAGSSSRQLPAGISSEFSNDEVGMLARTLEQAMQRINGFVERERRFARDASHELRTPVTVSKGVLELLQQMPAGQHDKRVSILLQRLHRAITDMENIIETFLWLGREYHNHQHQSLCEITRVVEYAIEQHRYLLNGKAVEISVIKKAQPVLPVPEPVVAIALGNLLRNALQNIRTGRVVITIEPDSITIDDTGSGIAPEQLPHIRQPHVRGTDSTGHGLGLDIVQRLCERFGWSLTVESQYGQGTSVKLYFRAGARH